MLVGDVMKTDIFTLPESATLRDAIDMLFQEKVSGVMIMDESGVMQGMLSEKDIYKALYPSYEEFMSSPETFTNFQHQEHNIAEKADLSVQAFMDKDPLTTTPDMYLMRLGGLMLARHVHRVPVVDEKKNLVGVITRGMLFRALFRQELGFKK